MFGSESEVMSRRPTKGGRPVSSFTKCGQLRITVYNGFVITQIVNKRLNEEKRDSLQLDGINIHV